VNGKRGGDHVPARRGPGRRWRPVPASPGSPWPGSGT